MYQLSRTVRFCVPFSTAPWEKTARHNTFAAWPSMGSLGAYYELTVSCHGMPDGRSGYVENISVVDEAVRRYALPIIGGALRQALLEERGADPLQVLSALLGPVIAAVSAPVTSVSWRLTPTYTLTMQTARPDRVEIAQQFEFAAAHRLHVDSMTEQENREVFGKCNNLEGHGHNYRLEVCAAVPLPPEQGRGIGLEDLERIVDEVVIRRFDHRHLNRDTEEFAQLNPSVEHITRICHDLLAEPLEALGAELMRVTVWETAKTSCTYPAGERR